MSNAVAPPRFVPTLTEVFQPVDSPAVTAAPGQASGEAAMPLTFSTEQQDQLVRRVLQRMDVALDRRLRELVGQLILEHTETLVPRLREEIERAIHQSVKQALDQETGQLTVRP